MDEGRLGVLNGCEKTGKYRHEHVKFVLICYTE